MTLFEHAARGYAVEVFHDEVEVLLLAPGAEDAHDVGMREVGDDAGFAGEAGDEGLVAGEGVEQHFDGELAALLDVPGAIDDTHGAAP